MNRVLPPRLCLRWPLPALLAWALAWAVFAGARSLGEPAAVSAALLAGAAVAVGWPDRAWRKGLIGLGFPLSWLTMNGAGAAPPALWLVPLALLLLVYPLRAWRDAPWFPTPASALMGLAGATGLPAGARALDAGCGLGDGMLALRRALPAARIEGVERSALLAWLARRRCRFARITAGDMWRLDWRGYDLVYLFQRPESMSAAWAKAQAELVPGSWLASLEFAVPGRPADAWLPVAPGRAVWLYRVGTPAPNAQSAPPLADNSATAAAGRGRRHQSAAR